MILEDYQMWKQKHNYLFYNDDDVNNFYIFFQTVSKEKELREILLELAYEIYELQLCMDGILDDQEG